MRVRALVCKWLRFWWLRFNKYCTTGNRHERILFRCRFGSSVHTKAAKATRNEEDDGAKECSNSRSNNYADNLKHTQRDWRSRTMSNRRNKLMGEAADEEKSTKNMWEWEKTQKKLRRNTWVRKQNGMEKLTKSTQTSTRAIGQKRATKRGNWGEQGRS